MTVIGHLTHQQQRYHIVYHQHDDIASLQPLPSKKQLVNYYQCFHHQLDNQPNQRIYQQRLNRLTNFKSSGSLLAVGAGRGYFVNYVNQQSNWQAQGLEISKHACQYGQQNFNVDITTGTLMTADFPNQSFDVITMYAVLEHMIDLKKNLQQAYQLLKPSGLLVIRVPNINSFEYYLSRLLRRRYTGFIFEHLHYFTPQGLVKLVTGQNFTVKHLTSQHFTPPEKIRYHPYWFITNLAKRFLEHTSIGGQLRFGNTLMIYVQK